MQIKLRFLGAVRNVTGSRHLLEANGKKILVDCGLYQERHFRDRNWEPFVIPPAEIDAVLLTHAHLDHCGLLPKLYKEGFKGPIYCTPATADIAKIILLDSARLQEEDAEYKKKRHRKEGRQSPHPVVPLYSPQDAEETFPLFAPVQYRRQVDLGAGIKACFCNAGHVLGSSIIKVTVESEGQTRSVVFSGDVGRPDRPIIHDPDILAQADYVLIESTYGDRVHHDRQDIKQHLADEINAARKAHGRIIVPSFALERSQELLYYVNELLVEGRIPKLRVYLDSPMAASITKVFQHHAELFDDEMSEFMRNGTSPFKFPGLKIVESTKQSKAINHIKGTLMVIAGSGMCTGGRIKHHIVNSISSPRNTILFVGYQAVGTLGRILVEGAKEVRIFGSHHKVQAKISRIHGFSAHADRDELLAWLRNLKIPPKKVFVVHGEEHSAQAFGKYLVDETGWDISVPGYRDQAVLH